jgi:HSP20 family protein
MNTTLIKSEFPVLRRMSRDLDAFFDRIGFERPFALSAEFAWTPDVEVMEKNNEFIVKADVPGMKKEDIKVELTENELTISGERQMEKTEKDKGYYHTERAYGRFLRSIPLPEGAKSGEAKAVVKDGVLEVKMPMAAANVAPAKRRLDIVT